MTTNAIYKAGVPAASATPTYTTVPVSASVGRASNTGVGTVSAQTGVPTYLGANGANGSVVAKAQAKNSPQS
jgi:hypothetical protein